MTAIPLQPRHEVRRAPHQEALEALGDASHWVVATLRTWGRRLRERDQLARLDDRMLRDIGLSRSDAQFLINKPFWRE